MILGWFIYSVFILIGLAWETWIIIKVFFWDDCERWGFWVLTPMVIIYLIYVTLDWLTKLGIIY